ncbi:hypothetical protein H6G97_47640 [Nostoc flagelliforme FACHB-838]|uniref:Uncharacterized protein n=1 Tax=Nostoc flagelliforme FACHB-838 TaxID=2692904 RepID=A0ABR8E4L8_9NOSO|nr:hypothetical protein [Nostoc flagelliforme]MBD2536541.1 hypothetical protein [Nostoc flagelliforme FACHB-838]
MNEKTVRKSLRVLVAARLIKVVQERKGRTSIYELTQPGEWLDSQSLPAIRQEFTTNSVNQNLSHNGKTPDNNGSGTKSGGGSGTKSGRGVVPDLVGVVVPNLVGVVVPDLVDEVYPNKVIPSKEFTLNAAPPIQNAFPSQESCVCETEQLNLEKPTPEKPSLEKSTPEEPTPQLPASLSKNSESLQQTDNPSCRSIIPAGSFEKIEQSKKKQVIDDPYKSAQNVKDLIDAWITDPTAFADDFVPLVVREKIKWNRWVLPWHSGERKLNNLYQNFNPIVVDFLAQELATKSKLSAQLEITHAITVMNTWEKTKGGWTNLNQRYQQALQTEKQPLPQQHTALAQRVKNTTSTTLEDALAQDHKRRQQEQSIRVPSNGYQHSPHMLELKAKLQAAANTPKVPSNTRPSSTNLREVEAQLKLALRT